MWPTRWMTVNHYSPQRIRYTIILVKPDGMSPKRHTLSLLIFRLNGRLWVSLSLIEKYTKARSNIVVSPHRQTFPTVFLKPCTRSLLVRAQSSPKPTKSSAKLPAGHCTKAPLAPIEPFNTQLDSPRFEYSAAVAHGRERGAGACWLRAGIYGLTMFGILGQRTWSNRDVWVNSLI